VTVAQNMESINSIPFAGKTITYSFYARKGANFSGSTVGSIDVFMLIGTGTDQNVYTGYTGSSTIINSTITLTSTITRYTVTTTVPTTATQIGFYFNFTPTGTAGANDYFDVSAVQIDIGSVALPFRTNGATIQRELAACQGYYQILGAGLGYAFSASEMQLTIASMPMRATPTATMLTTTPYAESPPNVSARFGVASTTINSPDVNRFTNQFLRINGFTGMTAGTNAFISSGQISLSSEL
jgi:hypothetical protein